MNSPNGTVFTNISGATAEDLPGTALTATTWYRRVVTSSACTSTSNVIRITVDPRITGFDISLPAQGHDTICTGTTPALLAGTPGGGLGTFTYAWASSTDNVNFNSLTATTPAYQPGNLTTTTWFRRTVTSGACAEISVFRITVLPLITGNTGDGCRDGMHIRYPCSSVRKYSRRRRWQVPVSLGEQCRLCPRLGQRHRNKQHGRLSAFGT
ncbi:MAG: hypothetical protein U5L72_07175 [Bacteroidales bacterium]|nr:hypothetical protein [Bacteroidales bacterium]